MLVPCTKLEHEALRFPDTHSPRRCYPVQANPRTRLVLCEVRRNSSANKYPGKEYLCAYTIEQKISAVAVIRRGTKSLCALGPQAKRIYRLMLIDLRFAPNWEILEV